MNMEKVIWDSDDFDFYQSLSNKDKLIYITDMYSGFFNKFGDDEDDDYIDDVNEINEINNKHQILDTIKIECAKEEDLKETLNTIWLDGIIFKKISLIKSDKKIVCILRVMGQLPPISLS